MGDVADEVNPEPVFPELRSNENTNVIEVESVCFNCHENGTTRLLLARIPFFREVIISSFTCSKCGFENRSIDPASRIQDKGCRISLEARTPTDLNRRVVCQSGATIHIPILDASFPTSEGALTTVEGLIHTLVDKINMLQPSRKLVDPDLASKLDSFVDNMKALLQLERPFTVILDDPSGNSFVENLLAPQKDPQLDISEYVRTKEQDVALGCETEDTVAAETPIEDNNPPETNGVPGKDEVISFPTNCSACNAPASANMKFVDIPHFKEVVIMATVCSVCDHKDNEVKSGGGIAEKGRFYRLRLTHPSDLSRDVLMSETASLSIPILEFESYGGTLGGRFTTLEGLLLAVRDQLLTANPFITGDSASEDEKSGKLSDVIRHLEKIASGNKLDIIFELRDPSGNSYIQNLYAPDPDPELECVDFERTEEDNDVLGLTHMNTADYENGITTSTNSKLTRVDESDEHLVKNA